MRVGLDYRPATVAPQSGIARQVIALEQALAARDDVELMRFSEAPLAHPQRQTAHCPPWPSPLDGLQRPQVRLRFEARFLPAALSEQAAQLYIATANMGLPVGRRPSGCRYVLLLHDLFQLTQRNHHRSRFKALAYRLIDWLSIGWSIKVAERIWTPSAFTARELKRLFPRAADKVRVLPNLVPGFSGEPADLGAMTLPARYWLAVGTREPRKNMPWFVEAWRQARLAGTEVPALLLVGAAEDLPQALRDLPGLRFLHGLEDAELHALYQGAERLWQPSYAEGFGLPVVEALSVGTPVAVARGSALEEVAPADAPRFDPHDTAALVELMRSLASQPPATDPAALRAWAARYGATAYRARLDELLAELRP